MTETLSHIALRRLNGDGASDAYRPLAGVSVSLSDEGTLCIDAPAVCAKRLVTNDLAEILPDGRFRVLGRRDNVVCSGGIKLSIEDMEGKLASLGLRFQLTAVPDERLGEAVTLLYEAEAEQTAALEEACRRLLDRYEVPRHYFRVDTLPQTETGKPARAAARQLALRMWKE